MYYTYMLRCEDNSIYTGITTDIKRRMKEHFEQGKKCAKYTFRHTPRKLECVWCSENRVLASKLEYAIKQLKKSDKKKLIETNNLEKIKNIEANSYIRNNELTIIIWNAIISEQQ